MRKCVLTVAAIKENKPMLQRTDTSTYDPVNPSHQEYAVIRVPKRMMEDLKLLAAHETTRMHDLSEGKSTEYGTPQTDLKRLALWVPLAKLVATELARRRKLKSWQE